MDDVIVVGGGPAGALAATLLARDGCRVRLFDRAQFPRTKLCGDTVNPGAYRVLADYFQVDTLLRRARRIDGMLVTGPAGAAVCGRYGNGIVAYAMERRHLDQWLLHEAAKSGVQVEEGCTVQEAVVDGGCVGGVRVRRTGTAPVMHRAHIVIAADGRHSRLAFGLGLARHPLRPRRWAIGAYFENVDGVSDVGEMHVRPGHYMGVAPVPSGLTNACLVMPHDSGAPAWRDAVSLLTSTLGADPQLGPRFARARIADAPAVLGPMAVDVRAAGMPGLLLAGDAAGFIDPMTGDGLNFALRGSVLASRVAREILGGTIEADAAAAWLDDQRRAAFAAKWRFNRALRRLVASPRAVVGAAIAARVFPSMFQAMIRHAGDVTGAASVDGAAQAASLRSA